MISLRQTLDEIEQREERERVLRGCYDTAIQSVREYAVEIEPEPAARFRQRLAAMQQELAAANVAEDYRALQSSFRGELRQYRDRCRELVLRLRNEVSSAAVAMQTLTDCVSANGAEYEGELNREVLRLEQAAALDDLPAIRATIHRSSAGIQRSFEQMQRNNQLVLAQLRDEIRTLHKTMEAERKTLHTDPASGAWNQRRLAERFDQLLKLDESFGVVLLKIVNWRRVAREYSPQAADSCLKALVNHLNTKFGADGLVGRWSDDVLAIIVEADPSAPETAVTDVTQELASGYPPPRPGQIKILTLLFDFDFVGRQRGTNAADFYPRLGQHVATLMA